MSNICKNEFVVSGKKKTILKFLSDGMKVESVSKDLNELKILFNEKKVTLDSYIPMPEDLKDISDKNMLELIKKYGYSNEYLWRMKNYDTLNSVINLKEIEDNKSTITLYMVIYTSWQPPISWLKKVQKKYKSLKFYMEFEEPNMELKGFCKTSVINPVQLITHYCNKI